MEIVIAALFAVTGASLTHSGTSQIESIVPPGVVFEAFALNGDLPTPEKPKYLSPTDMAPSVDGKLLLVAQQTAKRIDVVDLAAKAVVRRIRLPNEVTGITVSPDGSILYATCSSDHWPAGMVCVVGVASGNLVARISVGHGARAPVVTPDGNKLFVCNRFDNDLSVVDLPGRKEVRRIKMEREPYCAAITPDGKTLVVGNLLSNDLSIDSVSFSSKIALVDVATDAVTAEIRLLRGGVNVQGIAVSPDGKYAFATHLIGKNNLIGTTVENGWLQTNNVAIIDIEHRKLLNEACLDLSRMGMGNPWGIQFSDDGKFLCVVHAGNGQLSVIDYPAFMGIVIAKTDSGINIQKDFMVLEKTRVRVATGMNAPRSLAVVGSKVFTAGFFSDIAPVMFEYDLALSQRVSSPQIVLDEAQQQTARRRGEALFYDANICFQSWQTCHSCHTFGRTDGRNWILGGGVVVAPKNTKSFVYSWWTPPTSWTGRRGTAQQAIVAGIEFELFRVPERELTAPIDTFFMTMQPVLSPLRVKGRLSDAAQRGKTLFYNSEKVDCRTCHAAPLFTDNLFWHAGITDPHDANLKWNTPGLTEVWRTAPYGHLGSLRIRDMVALPTMSNKAKDLSSQEIDDLTAYVLSL